MKKLNLVELNAQEVKSVEGGSFGVIGQLLYEMVMIGVDNRETIKKGPGNDPYYP